MASEAPTADEQAQLAASELTGLSSAAPEEAKNAESPRAEEMHVISFSVAIPSGKKLSFQLGAHDVIADLKQYLMDVPDTCHYTAYFLKLNDQVLNPAHEVSSVAGFDNGCTVTLVEAPYSEREARLHVSRLLDLLFTVVADTPLPDSTTTPKLPPVPQDSLHFSLYPHPLIANTPRCVRSVAMSSWNPPPPYRKVLGDLFYLDVVTLEGAPLCVTSSVNGFFVNKCTVTTFNPEFAEQHLASHALVDLLREASPQFRVKYHRLMEVMVSRHPYNSVQASLVNNGWCGRIEPHVANSLRANRHTAQGFELDVGGQQRDWNHEYQSNFDLPATDSNARLQRDRIVHRIMAEFTEFAIQGAVAVIDGNAQAINPLDTEERLWMYMYHNILFTRATETREAVQDEVVAYKQASLDLQGIRIVQGLGVNGIYTLPSAVIDYKGKRLHAQCMVPGFAQPGEAETQIAFGTVDSGKHFFFNDSVKERVDALTDALHLKHYTIVDGEGQKHRIACPPDVKGLLGNDRRFYAFDLLRVTPRDANYPEEADINCVLRWELVHQFVVYKTEQLARPIIEKHRQELAVRLAARATEQKPAAEAEQAPAAEAPAPAPAPADAQPTDGKPEDAAQSKQVAEPGALDIDEKELEAENARLSEALSHVNVRLHAGLLAKGVKLDEAEPVDEDMALLKEAATYLVDMVIPRVVQELYSVEAPLWDGQTLSQHMHLRGVNMRYLGAMTALLPDTLPLKNLCLTEMIVRASKYLLNAFIRDVQSPHLPAALAHFLNVFTGGKGKASSKVALVVNPFAASMPPAFALTSTELWQNIVAEVKLRFKYDLTDVNRALTQTLPAVRNLCLKTGIKIRTRDYALSTAAPFTAADILDVQPVVKHVVPVSQEAQKLMEYGRLASRQGNLPVAKAFWQEALGQLQQVLSPMHANVATCLSHLATVHYNLNDDESALDCEYRALLINERVLGMDHPDVIHGYQSLAVLCHRLGKPSAINHMQRACYLAHVVAGFDQPAVALYYSAMAWLVEEQQPQLAISLLQKCVDINVAHFGADHPRTATYYRALALMYTHRRQWKQAHELQLKTAEVFLKVFGPEDPRSIQAAQWVQLMASHEDPQPKHKKKLEIKTGRSVTSELPVDELVRFINSSDELAMATKAAKAKRKAAPKPAANISVVEEHSGDESPTPAVSTNGSDGATQRKPKSKPSQTSR